MRPDAKQHIYAQSEQSTRMPSPTQENVWISIENEIEDQWDGLAGKSNRYTNLMT